MDNKKIQEILSKEMVKALGCTEPAAIAYASSLARSYTAGEVIEKIYIHASRNIIKNAMAVTIPGTETCGVNYAAALGAVSNNPEKKT